MIKNNIEAIKTDDLIVIKQLPVIEEQLKRIKGVIERKTAEVLALECTEDTVKEIKELRATLKKDFQEFEDRRKLVKSRIMQPYEVFDKKYKEYIKDVFTDADMELRERICQVDDRRKEEKRAEVEAYFNEYLKSKNIDFVDFSDVPIVISLSSTKRGLREQATAFVDRICEDLKLIDTQEHKDEILYEYKKTLNAPLAIATVIDRRRVLEEKKPAGTVKNAFFEVLAPPKVEKIKTVKLTVRGTDTQLRSLKEFLTIGSYDFE